MKISLSILCLIFFSFNNLYAIANDAPKINNDKKKNLNLWNKWISKKKSELETLNFKPSTLKHFDNLSYIKRVVELDRKQPEFKLTFDEYTKKVIPKSRIKNARKYRFSNRILFKNIEKKYKVPSALVVSLWGIESSFGKHTGKFDVLNSLATLAFDGRRAEFFFKELKQSLNIIDKGLIDRNSLKGSWAGAIGQTQFMPSTFINYAEDFNKDGKFDLLNSKEDALASAANYLTKIGWDDNIKWGEEVFFEIKDIEELKSLFKEKIYKKQEYWEKMGINLKNNYHSDTKLKIVIPDNEIKRFFLVSKNYDVILNWNRSNYFALSVFLLMDEVLIDEK